ncbi:hypothetical protein PsYK624_079170 [Phanerochaete sordida]|uniref:Uncharacterized protein n=1 Tax=Phanerochaete sordida TaxID=48140 RepID=A0A9P3LDQ6_9APHY|nr:hypothetical protein PsYK624_079170 [Phanerochaete sordida]
MRVLQLAYVDYRDYPGGPGAFELYNGSLAVNVIGTAAYLMNAWLADALMLYRFHVIWSASRYQYAVIPALLAFVLSIISSCILLAQIADPGGALWISASANMALTFWSTSVTLTCYCTLAIAARLLYMRHTVRALFGAHAQVPYLSLTAMLVESAALYAAFALAFLATYARGNPASFMLLAILGQVQSIAPLLIVLRVAQGRGWTAERVRETQRLATGTVQFCRPAHSTDDGSDTAAGSAGSSRDAAFGECPRISLCSKTSEHESAINIVAEPSRPRRDPLSDVV